MSFRAYESYRETGVAWLGARPSHWALKRFKQIFRERDERSADGTEELLSVSAYTGVSPRRDIIDEGEHLSRAESLEGYKKCRPDDLVMNIMLAWNRGLGFARQEGIVSPAYCVFQVKDGSSPGYLDYLLRSDDAIRYFKAFSAGVIDSRLRLYPDSFLSLACALPPRAEQVAIAAFLDRETAKIDALMEEQRRLVELLKEKRQAVVSHAAIKGLAPSAAVKDSGVEWIGEVPAHWDVVPMSKLAKVGTSITYGIIQAGPDVEGGVPYIRTSDMSGDALPRDGYLRTSPEIDAAYSRSKVRPGDLVIAIRATIGKPLLVPPYLDGANLTQGTARFSPGPDCLAAYVRYCLLSRGAEGEFERLAKGATFKEITLEMLRKLRIPRPPLSEQRQIVEHIEVAASGFDDLIAAATEALALLQERRAALISAAVTGKIDVRGWTAADVRRAVAAEIVRLHARKPTFGRVKNQKLLYLVEAHAGISEIGGRYERQAAGPYDGDLIPLVERDLEGSGVMKVSQPDGHGSTVSYTLNRSWNPDGERLKAMLGPRLAAFEHVNAKLADLNTHDAEAVATLYAVWNDALIDGEACDDARVIRGFLDEWHPEKRQKFKAAELNIWLGWMRRNGFIPKGQGPRTGTKGLFG